MVGVLSSEHVVRGNQVKQLPDANVSNEDPAAYLDLSLLGELRQQGFFDQMRQIYGG